MTYYDAEKIADFFANWGEPMTGSRTADVVAGFIGWAWDLRDEFVNDLASDDTEKMSGWAADIAYSVQCADPEAEMADADALAFINAYGGDIAEEIVFEGI